MTEAESGSGLPKNNANDDSASTNRSRKDYIIALEDDAPMTGRFDPVFRMLKRLAKRTRGQLAVMDYTNEYRRRPRYMNSFRDAEEDYDDDDDFDRDDDRGDDDNFGFRGKQSLIGRNIINNFLGLKKFGIEEERPRQRDDVRSFEDEIFEDRERESREREGRDFAPSVVYEMADEDRGDDYDNEEDDGPFSRGFQRREPMFLFGNDEDKKKK